MEERPPFILYGNIFYVYRFAMNASSFAGFAISEINAAETEIKFTPGSMLKYDIGVEYPMGRLLSLMIEYNGSTQNESKAEYLSTGANAAPDLNLKDTTEYTLYKP